MHASIYSHDVIERSEPELRQGWALAESLRRPAPGPDVEDKFSHVKHYKGIPYIAIRAVRALHGGLTPFVGRKRRHKRLSQSPTTFGPGFVTKSAPSQSNTGPDSENYDPVEGHPLNELIERPNSQETFSELDCYLTLNFLLTGDGIMWAMPNARGRPVELWALPRALCYPQQQRSVEYPSGAWRVMPYYSGGTMGWLPGGFAGSGAVVPAEEIKRFLDPDPLYKFNGKSPVEAGSFQLDILEMIDEARWAAFDHGVSMDCVIQIEGATEDQVTRLTKKMEAKHGGARNARRVLVVSTQPGTNGRPVVNSLSQSPREMDFNASHEQQTAVACALWGVPSIVPGLKSAGSYSELYAAKQQLREAQQDTVRRKSEFYTKALAWPYSKQPGEYRIQLQMPELGDQEMIDKQLDQDAKNGAVTANQYFAVRNRPRVPDGDIPISVWVKLQEEKFIPKPQPMPGLSGQPDAGQPDASQPAADPLAALLGGDQPTAGDVPQPDNPDGEGSRPPLAKSRRLFKADQQRQEGEKWQGESGKWFTLKNGRTVPTAGPGGGQTSAPAGHGGTPAAGGESGSVDSASLRAAAATAIQGMEANPGGATAEQTAAVRAALPHMTDQEKAALGKRMGATTSPPDGATLENAKLGKTLHPNVQIRHTAGGDWVVKGRNGKRAAVENEATVSALAKQIGLNVPQVHSVKMYGQDFAVVEFVGGRALVGMSAEERADALSRVPKDDLEKHALFDYLIGSADPNNGNYLIGEGGEFIAIDKEQSLRFGGQGDKAHFRIPYFLADVSLNGVAGDYEFAPGTLREMAAQGETVIASLTAQGRAKDARGVQRRLDVLRSLAASGQPVSATDIDTAGQSYDKLKAPRGIVGRLKALALW